MGTRKCLVFFLSIVLLGERSTLGGETYESRERFDEEMLLTRRDGAKDDTDTLVAMLQFTTRLEQSEKHNWKHFNLLPKQFTQIMGALDIEEMKLTFSKGTWKAVEWGAPLNPAPSGLQLWAAFPDKLIESEYGKEPAWRRITRGLSGLTCASLESLDQEKLSSIPVMPAPKDASNETLLTSRYGQLSSEASCTENLTPWFKLLPCREIRGLSQYLVPATIFRSPHHTFSVHFRRLCATDGRSWARDTGRSAWLDCHTPALELILSISIVIEDVPKSQSSLAALLGDRKLDSDDSYLVGSCPLSSLSRIYTQIDEVDGCEPGNFVEVADLKALSKGTTPKLPHHPLRRLSSPLLAHRYATGSSRVSGGSVVVLHNKNESVEVRALDLIPSFLKIDPASIDLQINGRSVDKKQLWSQSNFTLGHHFESAPSQLKFRFALEPHSYASISYEFKQQFLPLRAFPPDPNRGFDVPAVMVNFVALRDSVSTCKPFRSPSPLLSRFSTLFSGEPRGTVFTESLTVSMPLPDFSMPYNVITLSSTVLAFFFGSLLSIATRAPHVTKIVQSKTQKRRSKQKAMLKNLFFLTLLGLAWLFENERDTFDDLVRKIDKAVAELF